MEHPPRIYLTYCIIMQILLFYLKLHKYNDRTQTRGNQIEKSIYLSRSYQILQHRNILRIWINEGKRQTLSPPVLLWNLHQRSRTQKIRIQINGSC
jgi:hypothetical protein